MIIETMICDICGATILHKHEVLPYKYSTDSIAFGNHTKGRLNENPSIIVGTEKYINLCRTCFKEVLVTVIKEMKFINE